MKQFVFLALTLAMIASPLCDVRLQPANGVSSTSGTIPMDPEVRIGTLPNGMKYYLRHNARPEKRAELRLAVAAGSIEEDEDQLGLAHFVEHMAFNGSKNFTKNELVNYLESVGTRFGPDLNAYTSFDETVYMLQVRTDYEEQMQKGLLVLEDWAGGIAFEDEEIDKERGVVISEWRSGLSAEQRMRNEYFPILYYNSRYANRLPIGDPVIVETASYETARRYYRDWYRPELMAVCIVGDIDVDAMEREIVTRFSKLENPLSPRPKVKYTVPGHKETFVSILKDKEATFTNLRIMYKHKAVETQSLEDYRQNLVHQLYNRMLNARLYELNNTADPPFVFASVGYGRSVGDLATYSASAAVPENGLERGYQILLMENKRVLQHGFVETELERQKIEMRTLAERNVREKDKTESNRLISAYIYHFLQDNPIPSAEQLLELYSTFLPTITLDEVNRLAQKWITTENRVIIVTGPDKAGVTFPDEQRLLQIIKDVDAMDVEPYVDQVDDAPLFAGSLSPVKITGESADEANGIHAFTLANGIRVSYKKTDFKNDQVLVAGYSWGGHSLYDDAYYSSAQAIGQVLQESGLASFTAPQLNKKLTGKTVSISPFIAERFEGFSGSCSPQDMEVLFQLIYLYATAPRIEEDARQSYIKKQTAVLQNMLSNPNNYFGDVVNRIRYEEHPRRKFPTIADLEQVRLDDMQMMYRDRFSDLSDFTFFFTGAVDEAALRTFAATYLGNLPSSNRKETWKDVGVTSPSGRIDTTFYRGEAPRSNVRVIYHGDFTWEDESRFLFGAMLDYLRIKLRESLREDKGGVYGVSLSGGASRYPEPEYSINIAFNSDPPRTEELMLAAYEVIDAAREGQISQDDLKKVSETQRQGRIRDLIENRHWHSAMINAWMDNTPVEHATLEYLDRMLPLITPDRIQAAVVRYFDDSNRISVVMHPEEKKADR